MRKNKMFMIILDIICAIICLIGCFCSINCLINRFMEKSIEENTSEYIKKSENEVIYLDENHREISRKHNGLLATSYTNTIYDSTGAVLFTLEITKEGIYKKDKNGNIVEEYIHFEDPVNDIINKTKNDFHTFHFNRKFDERNNMIESICEATHNGKVTYEVQKFKYDENNKYIHEEYSNTEHNVHYEHDFDPITQKPTGIGFDYIKNQKFNIVQNDNDEYYHWEYVNE